MTIQLFRKTKKIINHNAKEYAYKWQKTKNIFKYGTFAKLSYTIDFLKILSYCILSYFQKSQKNCHIQIVI